MTPHIDPAEAGEGRNTTLGDLGFGGDVADVPLPADPQAGTGTIIPGNIPAEAGPLAALVDAEGERGPTPEPTNLLGEPEPEEPAGTAVREYVVLVRPEKVADVPWSLFAWVELGRVEAASRGRAWEAAVERWQHDLDPRRLGAEPHVRAQLVPARYWQQVESFADVVVRTEGL